MRSFDHHELWEALETEFQGRGEPVRPGSPQHFTGTHEAKQLAVSAFLRLQHENRWKIMTQRTFERLFGTIAALGVVTGVVSAIIYFSGLPMMTETTAAWVMFSGVVATGVSVAALIIRAIWTN